MTRNETRAAVAAAMKSYGFPAVCFCEPDDLQGCILDTFRVDGPQGLHDSLVVDAGLEESEAASVVRICRRWEWDEAAT
jgi:hypothetical protein